MKARQRRSNSWASSHPSRGERGAGACGGQLLHPGGDRRRTPLPPYGHFRTLDLRTPESISNRGISNPYFRPLEPLGTTCLFEIRPDSRLKFPEPWVGERPCRRAAQEAAACPHTERGQDCESRAGKFSELPRSGGELARVGSAAFQTRDRDLGVPRCGQRSIFWNRKRCTAIPRKWHGQGIVYVVCLFYSELTEPPNRVCAETECRAVDKP